MRVFEQKVRFASLTPPSDASVFVPVYGVVEVDVRALLEFFVGDFGSSRRANQALYFLWNRQLARFNSRAAKYC